MRSTARPRRPSATPMRSTVRPRRPSATPMRSAAEEQRPSALTKPSSPARKGLPSRRNGRFENEGGHPTKDQRLPSEAKGLLHTARTHSVAGSLRRGRFPRR
jgi:hypothetical protein